MEEKEKRKLKRLTHALWRDLLAQIQHSEQFAEI
jgi:hypothetical protein